MSKETYTKYTYLVIDAKTDLPCACIDRYRDVQRFLGCCSATLQKLLNENVDFRGYKVEKVYIG